MSKRLPLRRLGREESGELVRGIIGAAAAVSSEIVEEIVERTDGVPLFIEELTKAVVETAISGADVGNTTVSSVPATSSDSPGDAACLADRTPRSARLDGEGGLAARRGDRARFPLRVAGCGRGSGRSGIGAARSAGSSMPGCCSNAACRRRSPTCSSTHWCKIPPTACCCAARAVHCTHGSPLRSKSGFPTRRGRGPKPWRTTLPEPVSSRRRLILVPCGPPIRGKIGFHRGDRSAEDRAAAHRRPAGHA